MSQKLEYSFKDALTFISKLNIVLEKESAEDIPKEAKDEMLKHLEFLLDKIG